MELEPGIADGRSEFAGEGGWSGPTPGPWPGAAPEGDLVHVLDPGEQLVYSRRVADEEFVEDFTGE